MAEVHSFDTCAHEVECTFDSIQARVGRYAATFTSYDCQLEASGDMCHV